MKKSIFSSRHIAINCFFLLVAAAVAIAEEKKDPYVLESEIHLIKDVELFSGDSKDRVQAVVEIPAFTRAKWEIDMEKGNLFWEFKKGKPRMIKYALPYPANYGSLPQTMLSKERGGDGDPLDVVILGEPVDRGAVVTVRVLAVMKMLDDGELDEKIIATRIDDDFFSDIKTIDDLKKRYPGILDILSIWFKNYKLDPDSIEISGFEGSEKAWEMIRTANEDYLEHK
jgi:inorganic pyrophosphatase